MMKKFSLTNMGVYVHLKKMETTTMVFLKKQLKGLEAKGPFVFRPSSQYQKGLSDTNKFQILWMVIYYLNYFIYYVNNIFKFYFVFIIKVSSKNLKN